MVFKIWPTWTHYEALQPRGDRPDPSKGIQAADIALGVVHVARAAPSSAKGQVRMLGAHGEAECPILSSI